MHIYCLIESHDFNDDISPLISDIESAINDWLTESRSSAKLIKDLDAELFGLSIDTNKKLTLKKPIDQLNIIAQDFKIDFVVGLYKGDEREDVCYFGFEEGKADLGEIANYLGMEK